MNPLKPTPIWDGYRRGEGSQSPRSHVIADIARDRKPKTSPRNRVEARCQNRRKYQNRVIEKHSNLRAAQAVLKTLFENRIELAADNAVDPPGSRA
jgi:ribosomal protein S30